MNIRPSYGHQMKAYNMKQREKCFFFMLSEIIEQRIVMRSMGNSLSLTFGTTDTSTLGCVHFQNDTGSIIIHPPQPHIERAFPVSSLYVLIPKEHQAQLLQGWGS
ncbi:hypothetical protein ILYODFUR_006114 [Ilyodon furcidens]|uniref:Uncharacterized protein n=1 Tax=Ilyodon furcidens TaxID=33524 RepID=A0ABV0UF65_9TELE